jgi:hypothetical protein
MALGVIFVGIIALCIVEAGAATPGDLIEERDIQVFPEPVTLVEISTLPDYISGLAQGEPIEIPVTKVYIQPSKDKLNKNAGRVMGPTNEETYYNLPMDKVIYSMRRRGYSEQDYPYYIREDGVKMLGDFVMVAADLDIHPRGVIVETSLGQGLVCDTGDFTEDIYDVATDW